MLRAEYFAADVGITGANFLVAETGTSIIVTNEGNGDLTQILPRVHVVRRLDREGRADAGGRRADPARAGALGDRPGDERLHHALDRAAARRATPTGRSEYHVVLLDNGRSAMLGTEFQDMLRCIRCGACMNHCPVYHAVGGHAYGWVYPGPMGAVLTPSLIGVDKGGHLPNASTFCGRCESVCPMRIPLPKMMRHWREREFERGLNPATQRYGLKLWAFFARRPALYRAGDRRSPCRCSACSAAARDGFRYAAARRRLDEAPRVAGAARAGPSCSRCAAARRRAQGGPA